MSSHKNLKIALWILLAVSGNAFSVPCVITLVKSPCWSDYNVNIDIIDASTNNSLSKVTIAKGVSWQRVNFDCKPSQVFNAKASFTPAIWQNQQGMIYHSIRMWKLPDKAPVQGSLWSINICYPTQFENVPTPLETTNCECNMEGIPPVQNTNVNNS